MNNIAINILSFNRPDYLQQVLAAIKLNSLHNCDIHLWQDGYINFITGAHHSTQQINDRCCTTAMAEINNINIHTREGNLNYGPSYSYKLIYDYIFPKYNIGIFIEDDLVIEPWYIDTLLKINELTENTPGVGSITGYGPDRFTSYKEQLLNVNRLEVAQPSWGYLTTNKQYQKRKPLLDKYFTLIENMNPKALDNKDLLEEFFISNGSKVNSTSVDTADTLAMCLNGQVKLTTCTRNATYIGKEGFHFTPDQYNSGYYKKDSFQVRNKDDRYLLPDLDYCLEVIKTTGLV